jgi:hypothetical protein
LKFFEMIHLIANAVITTKLFNNFCISIILLNSLAMILDDT